MMYGAFVFSQSSTETELREKTPYLFLRSFCFFRLFSLFRCFMRLRLAALYVLA